MTHLMYPVCYNKGKPVPPSTTSYSPKRISRNCLDFYLNPKFMSGGRRVVSHIG